VAPPRRRAADIGPRGAAEFGGGGQVHDVADQGGQVDELFQVLPPAIEVGGGAEVRHQMGDGGRRHPQDDLGDFGLTSVDRDVEG
jgi:hypothetical protein